MENETREQIALARFKLISPVLAEPARARNAYFREQAGREHDFPHYGPRRYAVSTLKSWLKHYMEGGFEALKPKPRTDCGAPRKITGEVMDSIRIKCELFPDWSARLLHDELCAQGLLGDPPTCYNTLLRTLKREGLLQKLGRTDRRKRFETGEINELWLCDFMHGPQVRVERRTRKAILCAIIDDHSRMIVGHAFNAHETVSALTVVLKEAFLARGVPKRFYVDNGSAFSSGLLLKACAQAGVSLIHSKPYDSPSRGKIERYFRTVRDRFLPGIQGILTLDELNLAFDCWLRDDYHHRVHSGIGQRPVDRYHASAGRVEIRRLTAAELDQAFLVRHERVVNHDSTISFKGRIYEVPAAYIRHRVELRHTVDDPDTLILYDGGKQVSVLKLVDVRDNARSFKPKVEAEAMSFSDGRVRE
jgi:putative transposase